MTGSAPDRLPRQRRRRPDVLGWACALLTIAVLTGFALLLVTGNYVADGPVLATLTEDHGLHEGDFFVAAGWMAGVLAVLVLTLRRGRRRG